MEVTNLSLAKLSDARAISLLSERLIEYGLPTTRYTERKVKDAIRDEAKNVVVSKLNGQIIGFGIMSYYENSANLDLLAVVPQFQGTGLAKELVIWLEKVALIAGTFKISVQAREKNLRAIKFYQALGYQISKKVPRVYGPESQVRLAKNLAGM